jgi:hypothetical protein
MPIATPRGKDKSMNAPRRRNRSWLVLLVALIATASTAVLSGAEVHDLDPRVWQAIVAGADSETPVQPLFGETR